MRCRQRGRSGGTSGGLGGAGGAGETELQLQRRRIREHIKVLKRRLAEVRGSPSALPCWLPMYLKQQQQQVPDTWVSLAVHPLPAAAADTG